LKEIKQASPVEIVVTFFQANLSDFDAVRALYASVVDKLRHPDVLFNNAGMTGGARPESLADISIETFEATWRVNTGSGILLAQLCLPHMEAQNWGRIIFCSSVAEFTGGLIGPHYSSSKAAIHGFVHWLAKSVAKKGVTVNAVAPALIVDTTMMGQDGMALRELDEKYSNVIPVGRGGRSEEIAQTVMWMINCGYVTSKIITVDGGLFPH
jgi:3-oxoacyl-[acyl-carrier protein] reductase